MNTEAISETPESTPGGATPISLNDLSMLAQLVDVAVQRGAFRASEIEEVGALWKRVDAFLKEVAAEQQRREGTEAPNASETEAE